jgi:hypothetical protein
MSGSGVSGNLLLRNAHLLIWNVLSLSNRCEAPIRRELKQLAQSSPKLGVADAVEQPDSPAIGHSLEKTGRNKVRYNRTVGNSEIT